VIVKVVRGPDGAKEAVAIFRTMLKSALAKPGCWGFDVAVHPDGADCDHADPGGT